MLKLENVLFRHDDAGPQYDFSLRASAGDIVGIMGASGSGKSTLLDLIAGFHLPASGLISWRGAELITLPPEDRPATIVFQNHNLFDHLTAEKNVAIGINAGGPVSSQDKERVHEALAKVGLSGKEHQLASTLSGGQQQRVALARSIVRDRPILLLDEPFNGLDDDTKADMLDRMQELAIVDNRCILMITHDKADCAAIATQQLYVRDGKLVPGS